MLSAYSYLPPDVCGDLELPEFPENQDCTSFEQLRSEVCGIIFRPPGALAPVAWYNYQEWVDEGKIDNTDPEVAHYVTGIGTFLPLEKTVATLAGGRVEENRERRYRLLMSILNTTDGHADWARKLQANNREFSFYIHTLGGKVIGGTYGLQPSYCDADFPFNQGDAKETINITIDTDFLSFPSWG